MSQKRRQVLRGLGTVGVAGLAGCLASDQPAETGTETDDDGGDGDTATPTPEPIHVGMVYALGGLGDKSFNDMAHQGIQDAAAELPVEFKNSEPERAEDFSTLQKQFAQSSSPDYDLVCTIGFAQTSALVENAQQFSDQKFMLVDSVAQTEGGDLIPNVANYVFDEHKGSFQVGHLAGLLTTMDYSEGAGSTNSDTVVGFVGGKEIPLIKKFQAGYEAGVAHADSGIEVRSAYAGSWTDPAKGKEIALSMYDEGADIVYHAAGGTGVGVFQAAQEQSRYAIGVDADQSRSSPEHSDVILASMVKRVDTAVFTAAENVYDDEFQGGSVNALGLEEDGVAAVIGQDFEGKLPSSVTDAMANSKQAIIDGDISVPTEP